MTGRRLVALFAATNTLAVATFFALAAGGAAMTIMSAALGAVAVAGFVLLVRIVVVAAPCRRQRDDGAPEPLEVARRPPR